MIRTSREGHKMDFPIDISSGSEDDEHEPIRLPDGSVANDERLIYQAALQDLSQPKSERDLPPGVLSVSLMRHQKIALEWMRQKEKRSSRTCSGGMLADDQGLGKTISTIALILCHKLKSLEKQKKPKSRKHGGTLVVCPASVVKQWAKEIYDKVSHEHKLSVLVYHGANRTKDRYELAKYDVVVTTYALVTNEVAQNSKFDEICDGKSKKEVEEIVRIRRRSGPLGRVKWSRVVLDEAQIIKNHKTQVAKACCSLRAKRRWCLSGTPIQNEIFDLYSYFKFLRYHPYAVASSFYLTILHPIKNNSLKGYKKLQAILRAIMLRRTKETCIDGQRILNLPPKIINLSKVDFSPKELAFYRYFEGDAQSKFEEYVKEGTVYNNYAYILVMLLRLRQACDHPRLPFKTRLDSLGELAEEKTRDERFPKEYLVTLLNILESSCTVCSVCNDPPKDPLVSLCGHVFCHECLSKYINGVGTKCPVPRCTGELGHDVVFSQSRLKSSINEDEDEDDEKKQSQALLKSDFTSTKIKALMEILNSLLEQGDPESPPVKTLVFSQWTGMLDLIQQCFVKHGVNFRRLDGKMSLSNRDIAVKEFNNDPNVQVMLMSLKAGNLGLNMIAATHVILLDLWWNPTTEDQAIDRAHRIGQTRTVTVTRITIKDTVEERILALQATKRQIVASALGEDPGELSATRLTVQDLEYLFYG